MKFPLSFRRPPSDAVSDPRGSSTLPRHGIFDDLAHPYDYVSQLIVLGASSISSINSDGTIFLLVANFWDGISVVTQSSILRIDDMQNGNTTMVQSFQTAGARKFHSFKIRNQTYVALANYAEHSSIFKWQAGVPISNLTIVDPGSGYLDGMIKLTCRQRPSCSGSDDFSAKFVVNETSGSIVDVYNYILNHGEGYLADRDVDLTYLPPLDDKIMDQTITKIRFKAKDQIQCSRLVHTVTLRPGYSIEGCQVNDTFRYVHDSLDDAVVARFQSISGGPSILIDSPGLFVGDLDEPLFASNSTTCRCKNDKGEFMIRSWCLIAQTLAPTLTYPKL